MLGRESHGVKEHSRALFRCARPARGQQLASAHRHYRGSPSARRSAVLIRGTTSNSSPTRNGGGWRGSSNCHTVFARLDPRALNERFDSWIAELRDDSDGEVVNIDGKTSRRSHGRGRGQSALHTVSAWAPDAWASSGRRPRPAHDAGLVLARQAVDEN